MILVGVAGAAGSSVAIPAHQKGDLILLLARRASASLPTKPSAGSGVPAWVTMQSGAAGTISSYLCFFNAIDGNTLTGTWTNADYICVVVLRARPGHVATVWGSGGTGQSTFSYFAPTSTSQFLYYAALTTLKDGYMYGVRIGTRGSANIAVGTAPVGWTNRLTLPNPTAFLAVFTRDDLSAADIPQESFDCVDQAYYKSYTIQIHESKGNIRVT